MVCLACHRSNAQVLKAGAGKHLKNRGYAYRRKCQLELARIQRVRALQQRGVALVGAAIASVLIGLSGFFFDLLAEWTTSMDAVEGGA